MDLQLLVVGPCQRRSMTCVVSALSIDSSRTEPVTLLGQTDHIHVDHTYHTPKLGSQAHRSADCLAM